MHAAPVLCTCGGTLRDQLLTQPWACSTPFSFFFLISGLSVTDPARTGSEGIMPELSPLGEHLSESANDTRTEYTER
eukprot:3752316-Rhodomonas_salina.2